MRHLRRNALWRAGKFFAIFGGMNRAQQIIQALRSSPPLPAGEGRGEGECTAPLQGVRSHHSIEILCNLSLTPSPARRGKPPTALRTVRSPARRFHFVGNRNESSGNNRDRHHTAYRCREAFSLIELLIVLAILIVLMTTYYSFGSKSHQRETQKRCRANLQKIYVALQLYANDSKGAFPFLESAKTSEEPLDKLVPRYTSDTSIFICPGSKDDPLPPAESFLKRKISYAYFMGRHASGNRDPLMSDRLVDTLPKIASQPIFSTDGKPPGNNHHKYGGNFLYCDGDTEFSPSEAPFSIVFRPDIVLLNPKP